MIAVPGSNYTVTLYRISTHNTLLIAETGKVLDECCGTYRDGYAQLHLYACVHAAYMCLCSCCMHMHMIGQHRV